MEQGIIYLISTLAPPVILAITLHEAAHAWVAHRLGDDTAYRLGRVTFNPLRHVDPLGTIILPLVLFLLPGGFLFGWAKPVPIAFHKLNRPRRDMVLVALAGPATNLALAFMSAWLIRWTPLLPAGAVPWADQALQASLFINLILGVFNMLPLPPLDGGRVAVGILPDRIALPLARLDRYGLVILVGLVFLLPMAGRSLGVELDVFSTLVLAPALWIAGLFFRIMGVG